MPMVYRVRCEQRLHPGDRFRFNTGQEWVDINVPHTIPANGVFEINASQLPFAFRHMLFHRR